VEPSFASMRVHREIKREWTPEAAGDVRCRLLLAEHAARDSILRLIEATYPPWFCCVSVRVGLSTIPNRAPAFACQGAALGPRVLGEGPIPRPCGGGSLLRDRLYADENTGVGGSACPRGAVCGSNNAANKSDKSPSKRLRIGYRLVLSEHRK